MRNKCIAALVGIAALLSSNLCAAETFIVGSDQIRFDVDSKYCFVEPEKSEFEREAIEIQRSANQGRNSVIAVFVECAVRDSYRQGRVVPIGQYGILLGLGAQTGMPRKWTGYTRAQILAELNAFAQKKMPRLDEKDEQARLDRAIKELSATKLKPGESKELGLLRLDEVASYKGMAMSFEEEGKPGLTMATVVAVTLLKDYLVQLSLYREFANDSTYDALLSEQIALMSKLVTQNETP